MRRLAIAALLAAAAAACVGVTSADRLREALDVYNDGVRWGKLESAAPYVDAERQGEFRQLHRRERGDLEITNYELGEVVLDKDKTHATAHVTWTWHRRSEGIVRETVGEQQWERRGRQWIVAAEKRAGGDPLPWLP
ncbi:MAG: hypothetical protein AABZ30_15995 [Myxococcota bacterium]